MTELYASDGSLVRTLSAGSYAFNSPAGIIAEGCHIWITNFRKGTSGGSVTELNASDASEVQTLTDGSYGFHNPGGIVATGTHIWVTNNGGNSVTELTTD